MRSSGIIAGILLFILTTSVFAFAHDNESNLTRDEAESRKRLIHQIQYQLHLRLNGTDETFRGQATIRFQLNSVPKKSLRLDFYRGKILNISVNGKTYSNSLKKSYWIDLPSQSLKPGANEVEIEYTQNYARDGRGLHRFVDPESKEIFLYSSFQSFDANRVFPCFDQPDLRATLSLKVEAPNHWQVISTMSETAIDPTGVGLKTWTFPESPAIATYLFSLHAGPFKVWRDRAGDIPLRLFVRPSMAAHVPVEEWFRWTKNGMKFFNEYFNYPYPFKKYDQLIVPEKDGAMENVAAVTFSEEFLTRSKATRRELRGLAETLLHEMAHMWFGNLVTMKWWNDLWLNEGFASFMSALAMKNATEFQESWEHFHHEYKNWAYLEDELTTTHPIASPTKNVAESYAIFDGITYGKSASVLQQLRAYVTPEKFQEGVRDFFKDYAFQNATREDFFSALQKQTSRDLKPWSKIWFESTGADRAQAAWTCEGDRLKKIRLERVKSTQYPVRPQAVKIAIYPSLTIKPEIANVYFEKDKQEIMGDWPCPVFVFPNFGDEAYLRVKLDPVSQSLALNSLSQLPDSLMRLQIWGNYWLDVREQNPMPGNAHWPRKYLEFIAAQLPLEQNDSVLRLITYTLLAGPNESQSALAYWPSRAVIDRELLQLQLEDQFLKRFVTAPPNSDTQRFWFDTYVSFAKSSKSRAQLAKWAKTFEPAKGFKLDLDRRWDVARQLMRFQEPTAPAIVKTLIAQDTSERGTVAAQEVDAIRPDIEVKRRWLKLLHTPNPALSVNESEKILGALFPIEQSHTALILSGEFLPSLKHGITVEGDDFIQAVVHYQSPLNCTAKARRQFVKLTNAVMKGFSPSIKKEIKNRLEEDERCEKLRASEYSL